jgi:hypothetical protein
MPHYTYCSKLQVREWDQSVTAGSSACLTSEGRKRQAARIGSNARTIRQAALSRLPLPHKLHLRSFTRCPQHLWRLPLSATIQDTRCDLFRSLFQYAPTLTTAPLPLVCADATALRPSFPQPLHISTTRLQHAGIREDEECRA